MRYRTMGLVLLLFAGACGGGAGDVALTRAPEASAPARATATTTDPPAPDTTTTEAPAAPSTTAAAAASEPAEAAPPVTAAPVSRASAPPAIALARGSWSVAPYHGFGAWLDTYDWAAQFSRSGDVVGPEGVDHMAAEGVQTLFIQASRWNSPTDVLEPERLQPIIDRAHQHGMSVVAWYLPTFVDPATDLRRILAVASLDVDGVAIDIESRDVGDIAERNRRLVELSRQLRLHLPGKAIGAIVLEPVLIEDVNPNYWPSFPWAEIAPYYDVWLPMSYWTNRRGHWRGAYPYTAENISRIRARIGQPAALVHTIGGIGDKTTVPDIDQMAHAARDQGVIGGSLYDYRTSRPEFWASLRGFRTASG
jgi:hypothetical protein